jgi:hypothetical protein
MLRFHFLHCGGDWAGNCLRNQRIGEEIRRSNLRHQRYVRDTVVIAIPKPVTWGLRNSISIGENL